MRSRPKAFDLAETIDKLVNRTPKTTPLGATHWSCRLMAETVGVSPNTVNQVWRGFGLYMNPPARAAVFCVTEMGSSADAEPGLEMQMAPHLREQL